VSSTPKAGPRRRQVVAAVAFLVVSLALGLEGFSLAAVHLAPGWLGQEIRRTPEIFQAQSKALESMFHPRPEALGQFDATLGWRPKPGTWTDLDRINSQGLRSSHDYSRLPLGAKRIAVFGDSFVYGSEVSGEETWPRVIERNFTGLEVLNYGVPGYGPDQAYLRFVTEGSSLSPTVVVLGIATPSMERLLSVVGTFRARLVVTKPRYVLGDGGRLILVPNPIRNASEAERIREHPREILAFGALDYWYEPLIYENPFYDYSATVRLLSTLWGRFNKRYLDPERPLAGPPGRGVFNENSTAFRILTRIIEDFVERARERTTETAVSRSLLIAIAHRFRGLFQIR